MTKMNSLIYLFIYDLMLYIVGQNDPSFYKRCHNESAMLAVQSIWVT